MSTPAIEILGLTKDYPVGFWRKRMRRSLDNLTLQVEEGEVFGFLGPNGAGKTTTLKLLMGLIFPTSGTARVRGRSIDDVRMHREIGYLPEQPYFYDYLTARELLDYYARFSNYSAAERRERVERFLGARGPGGRGRRAAAKILEGHAAARGNRAGDPARPRGRVSRRADVRARSGGTAGSARHHPRPETTGAHRIFLDAHSLGRGDAVRPRRGAGGRQTAGRGRAGRNRLDGSRTRWKFCSKCREGRALPAALSGAAVAIGARYRVEVPEGDLYCTLDNLRGCEARILSVSPVRPTLEDYFMRLVGASRPRYIAVEEMAR